MILIHFQVLGKDWTLRVLRKKKYTKKRGKDSAAVTIMIDRKIDVHIKGLSTETVIHELVHAYTYELCVTSCNKIKADDWEEFFCELMSKFGQELLDLANSIHIKAIELIGISKAPKPAVVVPPTTPPPSSSPSLPPTHFASEEWVNVSPCGDRDERSDVTNNYADVTCEKCKAHLIKGLN